MTHPKGDEKSLRYSHLILDQIAYYLSKPLTTQEPNPQLNSVIYPVISSKGINS